MTTQSTTPALSQKTNNTLHLLRKRNRGQRNSSICLVILLAALVTTGCRKEAVETVNNNASEARQTDETFLKNNAGFSPRTVKELISARLATAKYRSIQTAIDSGYADISVILPNMGYHYMKSALSDSVFEADKPEILVYNKMEDGKLELVAVEYAVPIPLSPDKAPEGFSGSADVWNYDTGFNLWTLHAWVWKYNPDGIFSPTNPLVHVHE